ncbi:MAG: hypothetical protein J6K85_00125 [Clostridia bacterium]|nr:hypothetical protein [Clostridia bacterium]
MENNNLNEQINEQVNENSTPTPKEEAKKPLPWWIFAAIGAGVVVIVAVVLILVLGGNKCKSHVDADDDYKCDVCGEKYDDGDEITMLDVKVTVKDGDGNAMAGVKFTVNENIELTTDANGVAKHAFMPGKYSVTYDYTTFPSGFMPDTSTLYVSEGNENVTITIIDNNPNGSAERPYFISENVTPFALAAGEELYYRCHAAASRHLVIESDGIVVTYKGEAYESVDGQISLFVEGSIDEPVSFSVKNVTGAAIESAIEMVFPLGSRDNPIELTENKNTVNIAGESGLHYKWTASADGVLVLNCETTKSAIGISKVLLNDVSISAAAEGGSYAYLVVTKGEEIAVSVSNIAKEAQDISFSFKTYSGTESEPVPVLKSEIDISLLPSSSISFMAVAGQFLTINNETKIVVSYNDTVEDSADVGYVALDFDTDGIFTVTNTDTAINGITMTIE